MGSYGATAGRELLATLKLVHHALESLPLPFVEQPQNAVFAAGADFVELSLEGVIVSEKVIEHAFQFRRLLGSKIQFFLEMLQGNLHAAFLPGEPLRTVQAVARNAHRRYAGRCAANKNKQ
jgi:hypothetical protein